MLMAIPTALFNSGNCLEFPMTLLDKFLKRRKMKKGYPETYHPFVPKILEKTMDFKVEGSIGLTFGAEGTEPASQECLEFIENFYKKLYGLEVIDNFPKNTIAVSIPKKIFKIGKNCNDFPQEFEDTKGHYTYKKLSESVQVTYFNDKNGVQFLAGICYYPIPAGKIVTCLKNESDLIITEIVKSERFLLKNPLENPKSEAYGRYCSKAQSRVLVWTGKKDGQIVHLNYDPYSSNWKKEGCAECAQDAKNYQRKDKKEKEDPKLVEEYDTLQDSSDFDAISLN